MDKPPATPLSALSTSSTISNQSSKPTNLKSKTEVIHFWRTEEVNKWLRKTCGQYYQMYGETFHYHCINGQSLMRLTETKLEMMGIDNETHREDLMRQILRLKLQSEAREFRTLMEQKNTKI